MPTRNVRTLMPSGGDYSSIASFLSAMDLIDHITLDEIPVLECHLGDYTAGGGGVDYVEESNTLNVSNTDATHPVVIEAASGAETDLSEQSGFRVFWNVNWASPFTVNGFAEIVGIEIHSQGVRGRGLQGTADYLKVMRCRFLVDDYASLCGVQTAGDRNTFIACAFIGNNRGSNQGKGIWTAHRAIQCIARGFLDGYDSFGTGDSATGVYNCNARGNSDENYEVGESYLAGSCGNAAGDGATNTPPGVVPYTANSVDADFTDYANHDYHPVENREINGSGSHLIARGEITAADFVDPDGRRFYDARPGIGPFAPPASEEILHTDQYPLNDNTIDTDYELGMKFQVAVSGEIRAIRYFRSPSDTGSHTGRIWSSGGTQLASVVFANESASGWQEQALATPLSINASTTYVVSVNNATSAYPNTANGLATQITNGNVSSVDDNLNGVFNTTPGSFPTSSFNETNYFRDIVFVAGAVSAQITPAEISYAVALDAATVSTQYDLSPVDVSYGYVIEEPTLATSYTLAPVDLGYAHPVEAAVVTTGAVISPNEATYSYAVDAAVLATSYTLAPADTLYAYAVDVATVSTSYTVSPVDLGYAHPVEAAVVTTGLTITPAEALYSYAVESPTVTTPGVVNPNALDYGYVVDAAALATSYTLNPVDLGYGHPVEAATVTTGATLAPEDLAFTYTIDEPGIFVGTLLPEDLTYAYTIDNATLQGGVLLVSASVKFLYNAAVRRYIVN